MTERSMGERMDKAMIRKEMRARRRALTAEARAHAAKVVCAKIIAGELPMEKADPFDGWGALAVYLASSDEIDLSAAIAEMLERGVMVVAPLVNLRTELCASISIIAVTIFRLILRRTCGLHWKRRR